MKLSFCKLQTLWQEALETLVLPANLQKTGALQANKSLNRQLNVEVSTLLSPPAAQGYGTG